MWDTVLNFLVKASSLQPEYSKEHCLAYKQSVSACSACRDVCPHQAISFKRGKEVQIDDVDCTGCGLCVSVCPSQALEAKVAYQPGAPLKCSQVKGAAQTVQCHSRLSPTDLLRLAGSTPKATLVRNECSSCKVGSARVPEEIAKTARRAGELAASLGRPFDLEQQVAAHYDATDNPEALSRRALLRGGLRNVQRTTADVLAPLDPGDSDERSLPQEMQRQYRLLAEAPDEEAVPWPLPRVAEGCILCPVCTNVCPTGAFSRQFELDGKEGAALMLEPERCLGCDACARACPVKVISLEPTISVFELTGGQQEAFYRPPGEKPPGGVAR